MFSEVGDSKDAKSFVKNLGHNLDGSAFRNPTFGGLYTQAFTSVDLISEYISSDGYGSSERPSICFGLHVTEFA